MNNVTPLPFKGDLIDYLNLNGKMLEWLWRDHEAYIPVRPICEALGISFQMQHRKLTSPESEAVVIMMMTRGADGKQYEMLCIAFPDFLIWLATITPSRVKEEARAALIRTRAEIKQVIANHYRERLLGEAVAVEQATQAFETEWAGAKSWRPAILMGCRNGWSFARIRAAARPSTPQWRIAEDIRNAHRLGLIDWMPQDTPAPRSAPQPTPETDPRQITMFAEG